jgi:hypothetical protein
MSYRITHCHYHRYPGVDDFTVIVGDVWFPDAGTVLLVHGKTLLGVEPAEAPGAPLRVSASFYDENGRPMLQIRRNAIGHRTSNWDIEITGPTVTVRNGPRDIQLKLATVSERGLRIDRLKMAYHNVRLDADETHLTVSINGRPTLTLGGSLIMQGALIVPAPLVPQVRILWGCSDPFDLYGVRMAGLP